MAGKWETRQIGDLGRVVTGKTPSTAISANFGGEYPFITIPDMVGRREIPRSARTLSELGAQSLRTCRLPAGAVMMSCIATIGNCGITTRPSFTNQQINSLICNDDVDSRFVYYCFTQLGHALEAAGGGGSVYTNVSKSRFEQIEISLPPLPEQRAIAHVLGTLDDLIELNRETNEILEEMARALFKSWFVDFDPVRAKLEGRPPAGMDAATAALFPDHFQDSELGQIPKGWEVVSVGDLATLKGGTQLERESFSDHGSIPIFGGAGIMGYGELHNADGFVVSVGRVGAYCGQYFYHRGKAWINNNASLIRQREEIPGEWLLLCLRDINMEVIKKGAAQPFVSNSDIAAVKVLLPPNSILDRFQDLIRPIFLTSESADAESRDLATLRDTLLPKLLSGEVSLKTDQFL